MLGGVSGNYKGGAKADSDLANLEGHRDKSSCPPVLALKAHSSGSPCMSLSGATVPPFKPRINACE